MIPLSRHFPFTACGKRIVTMRFGGGGRRRVTEQGVEPVAAEVDDQVLGYQQRGDTHADRCAPIPAGLRCVRPTSRCTRGGDLHVDERQSLARRPLFPGTGNVVHRQPLVPPAVRATLLQAPCLPAQPAPRRVVAPLPERSTAHVPGRLPLRLVPGTTATRPRLAAVQARRQRHGPWTSPASCASKPASIRPISATPPAGRPP